MRRRESILLVGAAITGTIAGCTEEESTGRQQGSADTAGEGSNDSSGGNGNSPLAIRSHEWYNEGEFDAGVRGQVANQAGETLDYVEVEVYFIDADSVQFEESLDNTEDLAEGRVWEFDAMFLGDDPSRVDSYEIEASTSAL